jgi:hypothetical protein
MRRLFSQWQLSNTQIRQLKAQVQGVLLENGINDKTLGCRMVNNPEVGQYMMATLELSPAAPLDLARVIEVLLAVIHAPSRRVCGLADSR